MRCKNSAKFFDLKVQSAKEILTLGKKRKNFFVLFSLNRNFADVTHKQRRIMETMQLRAELFREMNPLLDSEEMLRKMLAFVRSLFAAQQLEQEAAQKKDYEVKTVSPDIEKWSGCATFTQEEIDSDPRLKAILSR